MADNFALGLLFIVLGGIMEGGFSLGLKHTPKWEWENTWGACSLVALILVPWPLALLTAPNLSAIYSMSSSKAILAAWIYGAGWGIGGLFFGMGLAALGLSLGLSLIMGLVAITGSVVPLIIQNPGQLTRPPGLVLMAGFAVMILGLFICAKAGRLKEFEMLATQSLAADVAQPKAGFAKGLILCIAAGILSSLVNFALIFGADVTQVSLRLGIGPTAANNPLWALVFTSNYIVNAGYCAYLALRNKTFANFCRRGAGFNWFVALLMGLVWAGGIVAYGYGATRLGGLGAILGFPIMVICAILAGNVLGFLTGEWKGTSPKTKRVMASGVFFLFLATAVIAYANRLAA